MSEPGFAQHAQVGDVHLETLQISGAWEWKVLRKRSQSIFGTAGSLEEAKAAAIKAAGISGSVTWKDIGPRLS